MDSRSPKTVVPVEEVREVEELIIAEEELQEHINSNPKFYKKLCDLADLRNARLEVAEKTIRGMGVSCGPFLVHTQTQDINVEQLYDELGPDNFASVGGYTETVTQYKIDRTRFIAYLKADQVPKEVAESCVKLKTSYKKPDHYVLP